jgi:hypothetical protein
MIMPLGTPVATVCAPRKTLSTPPFTDFNEAIISGLTINIMLIFMWRKIHSRAVLDILKTKESLTCSTLIAFYLNHHHHRPLIPLNGTTCFLFPFSSITRHLHVHSFYSFIILHIVHSSFLRANSARVPIHIHTFI